MPSGSGCAFREAAVTVLADHLAAGTELLAARAAVPALPAGDEVVQADAVTRAWTGDATADLRDDARHLVPERQRMARRSPACAVVRVGMADARRHHAHDDLARARGGRVERRVDERAAWRIEPHGAISHEGTLP